MVTATTNIPAVSTLLTTIIKTTKTPIKTTAETHLVTSTGIPQISTAKVTQTTPGKNNLPFGKMHFTFLFIFVSL